MVSRRDVYDNGNDRSDISRSFRFEPVTTGLIQWANQVAGIRTDVYGYLYVLWLDVRIMPCGTRHCDRSNPRDVDTSIREDPRLIFYRFN